jgi:hypothetical protein
MREFRERDSAWPICADVLLIFVGIALIGFGGWEGLKIWLRGPICLTGFIICLGGSFLICKDLLSVPVSRPKSTLESQGVCLGRFHLNGYLFEAYEREADNGGRQFRLVSFPAVNPEREAAFIRYMVREGLIEDMWRDMSDKIEIEAHWAFFES